MGRCGSGGGGRQGRQGRRGRRGKRGTAAAHCSIEHSGAADCRGDQPFRIHSTGALAVGDAAIGGDTHCLVWDGLDHEVGCSQDADLCAWGHGGAGRIIVGRAGHHLEDCCPHWAGTPAGGGREVCRGVIQCGGR